MRMQHVPVVPNLPGFTFDRNLGRTRFHKSQLLEIHDGVYYLFEKEPTKVYNRYSYLYPEGEAPEIPSWITFDGKRLMFKAFFQETVQERWKTFFHIRVVNISFFLEDGTIKVMEPSVDNSGLEQGILVRRQKIPIPDSVNQRYYDILDLNIGKEPLIFGRVYKIVDCDKFTRHFLNRMGIPVPDPIDLPKDPYTQARKMQDETFAKKPGHTVDTLGSFLKYDRHVLRFYGYWDDTESLHGIIHDLELHYFLSDDTIEIKEKIPPNSGRDAGPMFVKRMKIPKFYTNLQPIGTVEPSTVLNVLGESVLESRKMMDALEIGKVPSDHYKDNELGIGAEINVFGKKVVLTSMDAFTKEYYRKKYGLDDFTPIVRPKMKEELLEIIEKEIPPYNGFGSYEDSLGNCFTVMPKPPKMDFVKFFFEDRQGFDSHILRFRAKMISKIPDNEERHFIIRVFLMDDTISIYELAMRNSGFETAIFQKRLPIMLPGQDIFVSKKPNYYKPEDFYVGARVNLSNFLFRITSADIYALRYMELNCEKFPKANRKLIMQKIRKSLQPVYDKFLQIYIPDKDAKNEFPILTYEKLKEAMFQYVGKDNITEHEIITIARYYSSDKKEEPLSRDYVKRLLHTELHRFLWCDLDRLKEDMHHWDRDKTGFLPRDCLYTILRGCRLPVDVELLNKVLDHLSKAEDGKLDYNELLQLLNVKIDPLPAVPPINIKRALWWASEEEPAYGTKIIWCDFLKDLDINTEENSAKNEENTKMQLAQT